jgi:hypothetical protein
MKTPEVMALLRSSPSVVTFGITYSSKCSALHHSPATQHVRSSPASKVDSNVASLAERGAPSTNSSPAKHITFDLPEDQSAGIGAYFRSSPTGLQTNHFFSHGSYSRSYVAQEQTLANAKTKYD